MHEIEIKKISNVKDVNEVEKLSDCNKNIFKHIKKECSCMHHKKSQLSMNLHIQMYYMLF